MDHLVSDLAEEAKYYSAPRQRRSLAAVCEAHNHQSAFPRQHRKSVLGPVAHDQCNTVVGSDRWRKGLPTPPSSLETSVPGNRMKKCLSDRTVHNGPATLGSAKLVQCSDMAGPEVRKWNLPIVLANLGTRISGHTMSEWWSSLSACVGTEHSRLHTEILAFCKANELTQEQTLSRTAAQDYLECAVLEIWPWAEVHLFGSTAMGLALPSSDIDIVVVMVPPQRSFGGTTFPDTGPWVSELYRKLLKRHGMFLSLTEIPHAKVPILKAVFKNGVACDVSFDWHDNRPGQGVQIVQKYLRQYEALQPLCIVLKSFLRQQNLNEVFTGGIGSFCLTIMVVSHLQNLERERAFNDLGFLLVSFFTYYSSEHNYATDVVCTTPGNHLSKQGRGWYNCCDPERLAVENPLDPTSDIGSASYNIQDVRDKFSLARRVSLLHLREENLLDLIFKACIP